MLLELNNFLSEKKAGGESGGAVRFVNSESIGPVQKGGPQENLPPKPAPGKPLLPPALEFHPLESELLFSAPSWVATITPITKSQRQFHLNVGTHCTVLKYLLYACCQNLLTP